MASKNYPNKFISLMEEAYSVLGRDLQTLPGRAISVAKSAANQVLVDWLNDNTLEWTLREHEFTTEANQQSYDLPVGTNEVISATWQYPEYQMFEGVTPMSRMTPEDWNIRRSRDQTGEPYSFYLERGTVPTMNLTYIPDREYMIRYMAQMRPDTIINNFDAVDMPVRWYSAFVYCLAVKLAPQVQGGLEQLPVLKPIADEYYIMAKNSETDNNDLEFPIRAFKGMGRC